jgi:hypothetical protein
MSKKDDVILDKDELIKFVIDHHKDCIRGVEFVGENLVVRRGVVEFDLSTVIKADNGNKYRVASSFCSWSRGKGDKLTLMVDVPFTPLTLSWK